jgi:hypothetical protein
MLRRSRDFVVKFRRAVRQERFQRRLQPLNVALFRQYVAFRQQISAM